MVPSSCQSVLLIPDPPLDSGCGLRLTAAKNPVRRADGETSLGMVVFLTHKKEKAEAILDVEGKWRCPMLPVLDRVLNALHEPNRDSGSDMPFGHAELIRVAAWLKGVVRFHRTWPDGHGRYDERGCRAWTNASVAAL